MTGSSDQPSMRRLLDASRGLAADLDRDPRAVLERVLRAAVDLTGARYGALGILNEERTALDQFLTVGLDEHARAAIGALPTGRGVLGLLIEDARPIRIADVGSHPRSYGVPSGHPRMTSFLGVPIMIRKQAWGNLYLTDKISGEFSETDEETALVLAEWTAIAVESSRLRRIGERRRRDLNHALAALGASRDIAAIALDASFSPHYTLELIAKRGRALLDARKLVIMLPEGAHMVLAASAGHNDEEHERIPRERSLSDAVLRGGAPRRFTDLAGQPDLNAREFGVKHPRSAVLVPMIYRGERLGVLAAFDREADPAPFAEDDERLLHTFALSAAAGVAIAQRRRAQDAASGTEQVEQNGA